MGKVVETVKPNDGFAILEPRVKHISEKTIRKKWKQLPSANHGVIQALVTTAREQSRQKRKGRAGIHCPTEDCVREVADKLIQKLPRIPFPPRTEESQFDLEANLNRMRKIEAQLTSNIHTMKLLQAQILKEEKLLKQEEAELEYLQRSLQSNETYRRQQSRTLHPTAQSLLEHSNTIDLLGLEEKDRLEPQLPVDTVFQDEAMRPVFEFLHNHLENMDNNIAEIQQVVNKANMASFQLHYFTNRFLKPEIQTQPSECLRQE